MSVPPLGPYVAASAWGARNGPGLVRRVLDRGRTWRAVLLMVVTTVFGALLTAAWIALVAMGWPLISLCFGLAALSAWALLAEAVARWWWFPRSFSGPVLTVSPSGEQATAWIRSGAAMVRPVSLQVVIGAAAAGEVTAAVVGGHSWAFVTAGLLAVLGLWMALPFLRRDVTAGGLYLTPHGLEHVWGSSTTSVPWDDLELTPAYEPLGLLRTAQLQHDKGSWHHGDPTDAVRGGGVPIPQAYLPGPPILIERQLRAAAGSPCQRILLGTPTSLEQYEQELARWQLGEQLDTPAAPGTDHRRGPGA